MGNRGHATNAVAGLRWAMFAECARFSASGPFRRGSLAYQPLPERNRQCELVGVVLEKWLVGPRFTVEQNLDIEDLTLLDHRIADVV